MILHDEAIADRIETGHIRIEPGVEPIQVQPASLDIRLNADVTLEPDEPVTEFTLEWVELPNDLAALLTGRSSIARQQCIVHKTAGWIDPGFRGQILLELFNFGDEVVELERGQRVAQLVFMELTGESQGYDGQYQNQGA